MVFLEVVVIWKTSEQKENVIAKHMQETWKLNLKHLDNMKNIVSKLLRMM